MVRSYCATINKLRGGGGVCLFNKCNLKDKVNHLLKLFFFAYVIFHYHTALVYSTDSVLLN